MPLLTSNDPPFGTAARLSKLVDQLQKGYYNFSPTETWSPNVNLYETEAAYVVCVDLAGVDKEKIDVVVHKQQVTLRGTRAVPFPEGVDQQARRVRVHAMEIDHGAFSRQIELPRDVRQEDIVANYRNGMLWIELPKR